MAALEPHPHTINHVFTPSILTGIAHFTTKIPNWTLNLPPLTFNFRFRNSHSNATYYLKTSPNIITVMYTNALYIFAVHVEDVRDSPQSAGAIRTATPINMNQHLQLHKTLLSK